MRHRSQHTGYPSDPTIEFTWALVLASVRHIASESGSLRGCWQLSVGDGQDARRPGNRRHRRAGCGRPSCWLAGRSALFGGTYLAWTDGLKPLYALTFGDMTVPAYIGLMHVKCERRGSTAAPRGRGHSRPAAKLSDFVNLRALSSLPLVELDARPGQPRQYSESLFSGRWGADAAGRF